MFTGIVESTGLVKKIVQDNENFHFHIHSSLAKEAYIDQSISHNGACLTVVEINSDEYVVTAIKETMDVTNLRYWKEGTLVNLERSMLPNTRLDGHFVQGHVDTITKCIGIEESGGSWYFTFNLPSAEAKLVVHKGSIAINGTSLTVITEGVLNDTFKVAIIPYTFEHTNFHTLQVGDTVNIEFDILGKYIAKHITHYLPKYQ